jgi:transcriptional regulator with XRE-family HTH domain
MKLDPEKLRALRKHKVPAVGNKLQVALDLADMSQAEVVRVTGLTPQYVSDTARGRHNTITMDNAWKFAEVFGCDPGDLFPAREALSA